MTELYRPSNGTEGEMFHEKWCYQCTHYDDPCEIQFRSMSFEKTDPEYPQEWQMVDGKPACIAFDREEME